MVGLLRGCLLRLVLLLLCRVFLLLRRILRIKLLGSSRCSIIILRVNCLRLFYILLGRIRY